MSEKLFECVVDNEEHGSVKCLKCGTQFDWDVHTEANMRWNARERRLDLVCPGCDSGHPKCHCGELGVTHYGECQACHRKSLEGVCGSQSQ